MNGLGVGPDDSASRDGDREHEHDRRDSGGGTTTPETDGDDSIRVLHVDDDESFADLAATFVTRTTDRIVVETETDAIRALENDLLNDVDCVVSDYDMPSMNGLEFLQRVRERWPTIPFILYTGKGSEEIASEAISAGVTDYLQKEVGTDQYEVLANRIRNAVDQHRAERRLEARDRQFHAAATESFDVIWDADLETGTVTWHGGFSETFGFDDHEKTDSISWWKSRIHPEDRDRVVAAIDDALESGGSWVAEYRFRDGDGEYAIVRTRGQCITDDDAVTMIGALTDVTAQRGYERQLRALHRATTALIDADGAMAAIDHVSTAIEDVLGIPRVCYYSYDGDSTVETRSDPDPESTSELEPVSWTDEVVGADDTGLPDDAPTGTSAGPRSITPADRAWTAFEENEVLEGQSIDPANRLLAPAESPPELYLPVGNHGLLAIASDGPIDQDERRLAEILTNELRAILDRIQREESLEESRRRLETLVSHLPGVAYRTPTEDPWVPEFVGGRVEELTGYPQRAFERGDVTFGDDLVHEADRSELNEAVETAIETGSPFELTYRIERRDGAERRVWEHGEPIFENGEAVALEGFVTDIFDHE